MHSFFRIVRLSATFRSLHLPRFRPLSTLNPAAAGSIGAKMDSSSIRVHNSLRPGPSVPFEAIEKGKVSWYACGPTVYDQSHLGHARNYVSTDVIRRILMHFFGLDVTFVMNITDIDDKIIIRARRQRLLDLEKKKAYSPSDVQELGAAAFRSYAESNLPLLVSTDGLDEKTYAERRDAAYGKVLAGGTLSGEGKPSDAEAKLKMHLGNMDVAAKGILEGNVFGPADEILLPYLDSLYRETIDTSDQTIFTDLTKYMEGEFFDDMDALNNLRPDVITRVTEYVPQIAEFVDRIVKKGFAYEAEGSVYFDINSFEKEGNTYARLRPESRNDKALQEEGEGSLSKGLGGKRTPGDFALWKKSKPGEPYWPSPWGNGRPGWHIECSVMAADKLGAQMDIHSGGVDLAFPHHDNELAQSEAYYCEHGKGEHTWVKYFLHMGHLSISGSKMSKSLKNFQTIKDALASDYSARNMRIVFMMGRWNEGVEISPQLRVQADSWENTVNQFFTNVKSWLQEAGSSSAGPAGIESLSLSEAAPPKDSLLAELEQAKKATHASLSNSFDTAATLRVIVELVNKVNVHQSARKSDADLVAIERIARWITKMVGILGLNANARPPYDGLGWVPEPGTALDVGAAKEVYDKLRVEIAASDFAGSVASVLSSQSPEAEAQRLLSSGDVSDPESLAYPYLDAVAKVRDEMRKVVSSAAPEQKKAILALSDRIRDFDLTNLGVYLDDRPDGQPSLIKFVPAAKLIAAREEKAAAAAAKARAKEEAKLERERQEQERLARAALPPHEMFKSDDRYAEWDADGVPTRMKDGSEVPKSQLKKLKKSWEAQKKAHDEYLKKKAMGGAS